MFLEELTQKLEMLREEIARAKAYFEPEKIKNRIKELEYLASQPDFWTNHEEAKKVAREMSEKREDLELWEGLGKDANDYFALAGMIHPTNEPDEYRDLEKKTLEFEKRFNKANVKLFLNEKYDHANAMLSFHAGTGGTDAQDWAAMLMRMYMKYAENHKFATSILEESPGQEAGIKSATIMIEGPNAYGYLKNEHGIHRLVRLSPFNAGNTRETSFALVEVTPEIVEDEEMEINKDDLRIDTFRSSGPGGQSVNKTDSAVRITHLPTGITVSCQNERSQIQNKEHAMKLLKGKLHKMKEEMQAETLDELKGQHKEVAWGNQIRSYVIHPYTMVKDHRTGCETSQVHDVLEGDLDIFIEAGLLQKRKENK